MKLLLNNQQNRLLTGNVNGTSSVAAGVNEADIESGNYAESLSISASTPHYIPIILTNNQSSATPSNFAQKISFNPSSYSSYLNSDLSNIKFSTASSGGTTLDSWRENGSSSSDTADVYWVNLGSNTISASGGTLTIYMQLAALGSNSIDGSTTGIAPTLSSSYGSLDNGSNVFAFYDNFAGSSLDSNWSSTGGTVSVSNGLTFSATGGGAAWYFVKSSATYGQNDCLDINAIVSTSVGASGFVWGFDSGDINHASDYGVVFYYVSGTQYYYTVNGPNSSYGTFSGTSRAAIYSLYYGSSSCSYALNYSSLGSLTTNVPSSYLPIAFGVDAYPSGTSTGFVQWVRVRGPPPSNVMPSVSFGTLV